MDIEMQQPRMVPRGRRLAEGLLQHLDRLGGAGLLGDAAGREVPHLPGRLVHDRVGEDGADVEIVLVPFENPAHRLGVGLVPAGLVLDRLALRVAGRQGADQGLLDGRRAVRAAERPLHGIVGRRQCLGFSGRIVEVPGQVVVRARGIGDAPMRHGAAGIMLQRLGEAFDRFLVIEGIDPVQTAVEPELRLGRFRRDRAAVPAEIVVVHVGLTRNVLTQASPGRGAVSTPPARIACTKAR